MRYDERGYIQHRLHELLPCEIKDFIKAFELSSREVESREYEKLNQYLASHHIDINIDLINTHFLCSALVVAMQDALTE